MAKNSSKTNHIYALHLARSAATLCVLEPTEANGYRVRQRHIAWENPLGGANSPAVLTSLKEAFTKLAIEERLDGKTVGVALAGDFCVTRVAAGVSDKVRRELKALVDRSSLYLSLGPGAKTCAEAVTQLDAKREQAWLSVASDNVIQIIHQAALEAGVKISLMEHSLVAICRAVGLSGRDAAGPSLLVEASDRGIDLGVSFGGRLLLDYRLGSSEHRNVASTVSEHLGRIQRYCSRHLQVVSSKISPTVMVCGSKATATTMRADLAKLGSLTAESFGVASLVANNAEAEVKLAFEASGEESEGLLAALGTALATRDPRNVPATPNLLAELLRRQRGPIAVPLVKLMWPAAAAIFVCACVAGYGVLQERSLAELEEQTKGREAIKAMASNKQLELGSITSRLRHLKGIDARMSRTPWHEIVAEIGSQLPEGVWLESFRSNRQGRVFVNGFSLKEDGVFDFSTKLKDVPQLDDVAVQGTHPARTEHGPAVIFDIEASVKREKPATATPTPTPVGPAITPVKAAK